ncbi:MAG TPA: PTS sugar transporter subunit IIA [Lactovum miscens]|uniref:PTS sugar transporter subunit IIA n=1 Tax=Lactovum miscens TaxID=190387 RepID=UPI002EDA43ED
MTKYLDEGIALFHVKVKDQREIFDQLSNEFYKRGLVTEEFQKNVEEREKLFPTGLATEGIGVAIPHTDGVYVKRSQIGFMSLDKPVIFNEMGGNVEVETKLIFMLALKEPHSQLKMLEKLVTIFQKKEELDKLLLVDNLNDFTAKMQENGLE